jgi:hypothetical protein
LALHEIADWGGCFVHYRTERQHRPAISEHRVLYLGISKLSKMPRSSLMTFASSTWIQRSMPWLEACAISELALTAVHHLYGGVIYASPFRFWIFAMGLGGAVIIIVLLIVARRHQGEFWGRAARVLELVFTLLFPTLIFGIIEGGYNHVVKNVVYFTSDATMYGTLFPAAGGYEVPGDWFFEITGILQFPLGVAAGWFALAALRRR